jgi:class 3 adenylate cyclase/tetratricopeptide (TPR) repeat protein
VKGNSYRAALGVEFMSEVSRWFERAGLEQYADLFESRNVSFDFLMKLTERDLEEFGLSLVARRTILREIERFAAQTSRSTREPVTSPQRPERRQLTLMFCDLVDSTGLSNRLDPEDLRDVIAAYQRACAQPITHYDGHVARYVGDGILAFFGYPIAHEDDAERAVRAGRELIEAVSKLHNEMHRLGDVELKVRIGIATGLVVVGDVVTTGVAERDAVAGEAANLASRLQGLAKPNTVVISSLTRQLAGETFEYRDLGVQDLKGFDHAVSAYEVIAEREVSRLEARSVAPTPFVGRDSEIEILFRCWQRAASGDGQVVIVSGEAGIGKSRVVAEACARIARREGATGASPPLIFQCAPYHANATLYPIIRRLTGLARIDRLDTDREKVDKLNFFLGDPQPRTLELLAELLSLEPDERWSRLAVGPAEKRHLTIEALIDWCATYASGRELIMVFEDVQWIDPTSKLFLTRLVDWAANARALIIITVRAEGDADAAAFFREAGFIITDSKYPSHVTVCEIGELRQADAKQLIAAAAEGKAMSAAEMDAILEKSAGFPLYAEELTKGLLNAREPSLQRNDARTPALPVPHTISDALMARLDQLGPAKEIAQQASVIGEEFSVGLLAKLAAKSSEEIIPDLNRLVESRLIVPSTSVFDVYHFRHMLIRDISYRSLLNRSRRDIHLRIANELARHSTDSHTATDDVIAQHYSLGGAQIDAIALWQRGAKSAIARSAHEEAVAMLESALADFRKLREAGSPGLELDLVLAQAMALRSIRGYSASEVEERLVRARGLAAICGDGEKRFDVEWGLFQCNIVKGDIANARQLAASLFEHAEHHPDRPFVDAHLANGMVAFHLGDFERAKVFFEQGIELAHPEIDEPHFLRHGQNPGLFCLSYLAQTLCLLGYLDRARATIERGLSIAQARARDPAHIYGYVSALTFGVRVFQFCGDVAAQKRLANEIIDIARRNHYTYYEAVAECFLGWAVGADGSLSEGINKMVGGIAALERTGTSLALPRFYGLLAELNVRAGQLREADGALAKAVGPSGSATHMWDVEIERLRGDILASELQSDMQGAEAAYRSSLAIAQRQNARYLMLKVAVKLARLLRRLGRAQEALELLASCLQQLPEKSDTEDVREAEAMIRS